MNKNIFFFIFFVLLVLLCIVYIIHYYRNIYIIPLQPTITKSLCNKTPYTIWLYWENKPRTTQPTYINMCCKTIKQNSNVRVICVNEKNLHKYLPNIRKDINVLRIPQKADYIRIALLQKYGGMWLDSDIIVYKSLKPLFKHLQHYDFVGFGCHNYNCATNTNGKGKPANWAMISRPQGIFISKCLEKANDILNSNINLSKTYNYHKLGRELLWTQIHELENKHNWNYYHFDSKGIERDIQGNKITNNRLLSQENIDLSNTYFTPLYNTAPGFPVWFYNLSQTEILNKNMVVSKMFRKAFRIEK